MYIMYKKTITILFSLIFLGSLNFITDCINTKAYAGIRKNNGTAVSNRYNIILILLDSVRADHLSCYGYRRNTSPFMDKLASEGILFKHAISQATWSLPSHCSILTSKYVPAHGVDDVVKRLSDSELTLAEILKIYGYKTAAFTGGFWVGSIYNVAQGFDVYYDKSAFGKIKDTAPLAINWLTKNRDNRFFLLLQGFDGHSPFNLPKEYEEMYVDQNYNGAFKALILDHRIGDRVSGNKFFLDYDYKEKVEITNKDIEYIIDNYDGSIAYADKYIGEFLRKIDELHLRDNTVVILTSYHGVPLFEHGIILRRRQGGCTEGVINVPLIIRYPGVNKKGAKINQQVQHVDIIPTVLDFLGIPIAHQAQGKSLVPLLEGKTKYDFNKYAYTNGYNELAIRTNKWKLFSIKLQGKEEKFELYNLLRDPKEQNNLIGKESKVANDLKQKLYEWLKYIKIDSEKPNLIQKYEMDKIKEQMKQAGYWHIDFPGGKGVFGREAPGEIEKD